MIVEIGEGLRRKLASLAQWGGWLLSLAVYGWSVYAYDKRPVPHWVGLTFVLCLGIAIAGTTARSRMRLTDTIVHVFRAGMDSVKEEVVQHIDGE